MRSPRHTLPPTTTSPAAAAASQFYTAVMQGRRRAAPLPLPLPPMETDEYQRMLAIHRQFASDAIVHHQQHLEREDSVAHEKESRRARLTSQKHWLRTIALVVAHLAIRKVTDPVLRTMKQRRALCLAACCAGRWWQLMHRTVRRKEKLAVNCIFRKYLPALLARRRALKYGRAIDLVRTFLRDAKAAIHFPRTIRRFNASVRRAQGYVRRHVVARRLWQAALLLAWERQTKADLNDYLLLSGADPIQVSEANAEKRLRALRSSLRNEGKIRTDEGSIFGERPNVPVVMLIPFEFRVKVVREFTVKWSHCMVAALIERDRRRPAEGPVDSEAIIIAASRRSTGDGLSALPKLHLPALQINNSASSLAGNSSSLRPPPQARRGSFNSSSSPDNHLRRTSFSFEPGKSREHLRDTGHPRRPSQARTGAAAAPLIMRRTGKLSETSFDPNIRISPTLATPQKSIAQGATPKRTPHHQLFIRRDDIRRIIRHTQKAILLHQALRRERKEKREMRQRRLSVSSYRTASRGSIHRGGGGAVPDEAASLVADPMAGLLEGSLTLSRSTSFIGGTPSPVYEAVISGVWARNYQVASVRAKDSFRVVPAKLGGVGGDIGDRRSSVSALVQPLARSQSFTKVLNKTRPGASSESMPFHQLSPELRTVSTKDVVGLLVKVAHFTTREMHNLPAPIDPVEVETFFREHPDFAVDVPGELDLPAESPRRQRSRRSVVTLVDTDSASDDEGPLQVGLEPPSRGASAMSRSLPAGPSTAASPSPQTKRSGAATPATALPAFLDLPRSCAFLDDFIEAEVHKLVLDRKFRMSTIGNL